MKKNIFLTGATGVMGSAGLHQLLQHSDLYDVTVLVRPSSKNKRCMKSLLRQHSSLKVIWGDLLNFDDVLKGVTGADYVLHVGGMVSPKADKFPEKTLHVNVTAAQNIVKAVTQLKVQDSIKVVYIGSVAQMGDRMPPNHWGQTSDPQRPVCTDTYAISKVFAESIIATSGIKHWVSLRQTGILHPGLLKSATYPITFHVPLNGVLEWCTQEDSGRLLERICEDFQDEDFWNHYYNISSGPLYRLTNYEFEKLLLKAMHCPPPERIFKVHWFALDGFHGVWYTDSQKLEDYLHFRENVPVQDYFSQLSRRMPRYASLFRLVPAFLMRCFMTPIAHKAQTQIHNPQRLTSWEEVVTDMDKKDRAPSPVLKEDDALNPQTVASFYGGQCVQGPDAQGFYIWKCSCGHSFRAPLPLIAEGGHWCEDCLRRYGLKDLFGTFGS